LKLIFLTALILFATHRAYSAERCDSLESALDPFIDYSRDVIKKLMTKEKICGVIEKKGKGVSFLDKNQKPIDLQQELQCDVTVKTDANSTIRLKLADGHDILVLPNSNVTISQKEKGKLDVNFHEGRFLNMSIAKPGESGIIFHVPPGFIGVRGTKFGVDVDLEKGQTAICLIEGEIEIALAGYEHKVTLTDSSGLRVSDRNKTVSPLIYCEFP
jgi:hypothetical protein